jgi:hypothetical protein
MMPSVHNMIWAYQCLAIKIDGTGGSQNFGLSAFKRRWVDALIERLIDLACEEVSVPDVVEWAYDGPCLECKGRGVPRVWPHGPYSGADCATCDGRGYVADSEGL